MNVRSLAVPALVLSLLAAWCEGGETEETAAPDPLSSLDIIYKRTDITGESLKLELPVVIDSTLENNFDIRIEKVTVPLSELAAIEQRAEFDPALGALLNYRHSLTQAITELQGADIPEERRYDADFSLGQKLPTGARYDLSFNNQRLRTNNIFVPLDPRYDVVIQLDISQPLLRDFGISTNTTDIRQAENDIRIAQQTYRARIIDTLTAAINTYWEMVFAIMELRVRQVSLAQAQQLLEENKAKFRAGTVPKTDVLQAEAGVAQRQTDIVRMRADIENVEDELRRVMNLGAQRGDDTWDLPIAPQTAPTIVDVPTDVEESLELARGFRPDYQQFVLELKNRNIEVDFRRNQLWPSLELRLSGQLAGVGGTTRPGAVVDEDVGKGYSDAFDNAVSGNFYTVGAGVVLEVPLGNRLRASAFRAAKLQLEQIRLQFERLKQNVLVETRRAIRNLRTARAEIRSTDILRNAQWKKLQAERQRFEAGKITSFDVLVFQEQFAIAQRRYIRSIIDYNQAFIELQRVQGTLLEHLNIQLTY